MKSLRRYGLIIVGLIAAFFIVQGLMNQQQAMPEISFKDIDGQSHSLADYKGKPILVIFWATDCPGCIAEMPELITLHNDFSSQGLTMIGVAMPHDSVEHIQTMRANKKLPYIITWDENAEISQVFGNVRVTPTHFLISPEGEIVMRKIGTLNSALLHNMLKEMGLSKG